MQHFFVDYLDCLRNLHEEIKRTIEGLSQEALDWSPGVGMNSLCVMAVHMAGSERYWFSDIIAREPSGRDRESEFRSKGSGITELKENLDRSLEVVRNVLVGLKPEDLSVKLVSPTDGREVTKGWVLLHVLEHAAIHLGHAQVTRQMWDQQSKK